jgi:Cys-rich protein (TIGR01571 family)
METPLEMHPSSQLPDLPSSPPDSKVRPAEDSDESRRQQTWSYAPSEKEQQFQHQGIMPDYTNHPPPEQHPANYAPLANGPAQLQPQSTPMSSRYATAHGNQQHDTPISPQFVTAHGNQQYETETASQPYTNQSYTTLPQQHTISLQYASQSPTNIPEQHETIMSPQAYASASEHQHSTPISPQSYTTYSHPQSYATIPEQQRSLSISPQPYTTYTQPPISPPNSPGPLPLKVNPEAPPRSDTMIIAPDANPLQSPKLPYFPPPTRTATANPPEDLSAYHQPGQTIHPNQEVTGGGWSNGLCEFSNFGICCLGLFCPCILYGRTQHRLSMKSRKEDPTNMLGYETCNGSCTGMGLLCGCQCKCNPPHTPNHFSLKIGIRSLTTTGLLATIQHTRTRNAYGIQGNITSDCVRATCCTCCTLIQDEKEIQKREELRARAARERGTTLLSPYTTPGPMSYSPLK